MLSSHSLPHQPKLLACAVHGEVDVLDIEGNMVGGLFHCATLTGCRWCLTTFVQAGRSQDFSKGGSEVMEAKALKTKNYW